MRKELYFAVKRYLINEAVVIAENEYPSDKESKAVRIYVKE